MDKSTIFSGQPIFSNRPVERKSRQDFEKQNENKQIIITQEVITQSVIKAISMVTAFTVINPLK